MDGAKRTHPRPGLPLADTGAKHRPALRSSFEPIGSVMRRCASRCFPHLESHCWELATRYMRSGEAVALKD